jgi:acyl-coenzyme A synthetase/AMP-(fatty) acid ligase
MNLNALSSIFHINDAVITKAELLQEIESLSQTLYNTPAQRWALCFKDSYRFMVTLLSLLVAEKTPVLLPSYKPGTIIQFRETFDAILSDLEDIASTSLSQNHGHKKPLDAALDPHQKIIFYTSGTTGTPQRIERSLQAIENEILTLEETFGNIMDDATIYSTVSHQHIYGLLFYIFWPLFSGRCIQFPIINYPSTMQKIIRNEGTSVLISSPSFLSRLDSQADRKSSLLVFSSGSLLTESMALQLAQQSNIIPFEVLGSTESGGIAFRQQCLSPDWQVLPNVSISVEPVTQQLRVQSPHFDGGEIMLGDKVQLNSDGSFNLLGRVDRIVKIEGKKICLTELQTKVQEHPWVKEAYALPLEAHRLYIGLVIILNATGRITLREQGNLPIKKSIQSWLAQFYDPIVLPKTIRYVEAFPVNAQGKIVLQDMTALWGETK